MFKLLRGSTNIFVGDAGNGRVRCFFGGYMGGLHAGLTLPNDNNGNFLDSPNTTTSATTYKIQTGESTIQVIR